jgi:hypothetical protein
MLRVGAQLACGSLRATVLPMLRVGTQHAEGGGTSRCLSPRAVGTACCGYTHSMLWVHLQHAVPTACCGYTHSSDPPPPPYETHALTEAAGDKKGRASAYLGTYETHALKEAGGDLRCLSARYSAWQKKTVTKKKKVTPCKT